MVSAAHELKPTIRASVHPLLSLDSIRTTVTQEKVPGPCYVGHFRGVRLDYDNFKVLGISKNLRCKSWACDQCRPKNVKALRKRIFNGSMSEFVNVKNPRFNYKFLTLTVPGKEWRSIHSQDEAYELISDAWHKLRRALKKKFGKFHALRVVEGQQDGYPHLHVLLAGAGIASKGVLNTIRALWSYKYFDSFANVDIKVVKNWKHSVRYITKYLLKAESNYGKKGKKFTATQGALMKKEKNNWIKKKMVFGGYRGDEYFEHEIDLSRPDREIEAEIEACVNEMFGDGYHPFGPDMREGGKDHE